MSLDAQASPPSLPSALPCFSHSMYSNGTSYTITNAAGELIGSVSATSSSDLAAAFQGFVDAGLCLKNTVACSRVEGSYSISNSGFQRAFNVVDANQQVLAVIAAATEEEATSRFNELVAAGICAGR